MTSFSETEIDWDAHAEIYGKESTASSADSPTLLVNPLHPLLILVNPLILVNLAPIALLSHRLLPLHVDPLLLLIPPMFLVLLPFLTLARLKMQRFVRMTTQMLPLFLAFRVRLKLKFKFSGRTL